VIAERVEFWAAACADAGITVTVDVPHGVRAVLSERDLTQILDIVLGNTVKYAGAGTHAEITVEHHGGEVGLVVRDDGRGVPAADLPNLSARFFRAANTVGQGTGLGLAIARALVERAGGDFDVGAAPSGGLRVQIRLPGPARTTLSS